MSRILIVSCFLLVLKIVNGYDLTLMHVNDIHVRFEETNKYSGACKPDDKAAGKCYGGVARLKAAVDHINSNVENAIFVNGGDFYQGNVWYTKFKWTVVAAFANKLGFTAMAPGNHEFDDGIAGFEPFLKNISFPMICCNLDFSQVPQLSNYIKPSIVVEKSGRKIGIIGYLTTETPEISNPNGLKFLDEVDSIKQEAKKLTEQGVDIIIAVGHSGYEKDQEIAEKVAELDAVVGGHSHSFLYTGKPPSNEKPEGPYPTFVERQDGSSVPVVQAYAYTKYLGVLNMTFDDEGKVTKVSGQPVLLDKDWPEDNEILEDLKPWRLQIEDLSKQVIGTTKVLLKGSRNSESNIGNFITDSYVHYYAKRSKSASQWTSVSISIHNSGGIRGDLEVGPITYADMLTIMPFQNSADLLTFKGSGLREILEESASSLSADGTSSSGGFLQVSGIKMTIDTSLPKGQRITSLKVKCAKCLVPTYEDLKDNALYNVTMNSYIANNGDGYSIIGKNKLNHIQGDLDTDVFLSYLKLRSPVVQGIEHRIEIIQSGASNFGVVLKPIFSQLLLSTILCFSRIF